MKPHVRYGHTPYSTAGGGTAGRGHQYRRPGGGAGGGEDDPDSSTMIEEYKLEEQLAPFYETASSSERNDRAAASVRCFLPPSAPTSGVKPVLRTISIMETLSELTNAREGAATANRRRPAAPPEEASTVKASKAGLAASAVSIQRRKKIADNNNAMASFLDIPQWYPAKRSGRPSTVDASSASGSGTSAASERVWDVSRLGSTKLAMTSSINNNLQSHKARSVQDILTSPNHIPSAMAASSSTHGYGSLERRRRRRPGTRAGFAMSARRGETDWEREEDDEEDDGEDAGLQSATRGSRESESVYPMQGAPCALFQRGRKSNDQEVERERARQTYKPPTEWFKKKRPQPPQAVKVEVNKTERGQTPDWIHKIFHVARRGHLLKLQRVVNGMEPTLVRNLSDHRGNNLLHVLAASGNADALAWLCSSFGPEMQDALLDENKRGLTPVVAAIQAGRLEALQFLVDHTSARERLAPVDGDRSLLHIAAKYGKIDLVAWLAQYMESHGFEVELKDHCGHSPLHLAARAGHASAVAILVAHGADVTAKNDMGHRPLDLASANGHVGVAQLLRLHDAALCLSSETLEANEELDNLRGDYAELKSYFRDVLVIGKRFAKERDEMCRQLSRLYEDVTSLHQALLFELRTLHRDLAGVRDRVSSSRKAGEIADRNLDESVAVVEALHDKWQSQQRSWFSSNLADMEHRLLMAEDGWKRLRTSSGNRRRSCQIRPHELLRSRLAAVNAQASNIQCDMTALSSSEGSLYSGCCQSAGSGSDGEAADTVDATSTNYKSCFSPSASTTTGPPSESRGPPTWYKSPRNAVVKTAHSRHAPESADTNVYGTLQAAVRKISCGEPEIKEQLVHSPVVQPRKKLSSSSRQELRKRLQEVKLTSESGNASVIEVIEPSSSEADDDDGLHLDGRTPRDQSTPLRGNHTRSFNASFSDELERARQSKRTGPLMSENYAKTTGADALNSGSKALAEPDLLAGTVVSVASSRSCNDLGLRVDQLEQVDDEIEVNHSTRSHSSLSSSNNTAVTSVAAGPRKKSAGFLTKFALKARWPSKRKSSSAESSSHVTAASPTGEMNNESSPDLSLTDMTPQQHQRDVDDAAALINNSGSSMSGVVAGLSQMFEDMSTGMKSPAKPQAVHQLMDKRLAGNHSPSRNSSLAIGASSTIESDHSPNKSAHASVAEGEEDEDDAGQVMDLPPSTSPPPVPLEIETYNSSPSSSQETSSSCSATGAMQPPPPPPRFSKSTSDLSAKVGSSSNSSRTGVVVVGGVTPSSSASSSTSASHGGVESLSVAASEDSGIVMARPASSASKSDSSPRAAVSSSSNYAFTTFSPLRKSALSSSAAAAATTNNIQDSSVSLGERLSPAPSDVSKTESASASDMSKTESMRHFRQLARIEEAGVGATAVVLSQDGPDKQVDLSTPANSATIELAHQSGQILTWREAKLKNQVVTPPPLEERLNKTRVRLEEKSLRTLKKRHHHVSERPWYDVSDDESDLLTPERLTKLKTSLSSSESPSSSNSSSTSSRRSGSNSSNSSSSHSSSSGEEEV